MLNQIAKVISTLCFIGKIPYCPGTFGSIIGFPGCYYIIYKSLVWLDFFLLEKNLNLETKLVCFFFIILFFILILFFIGVYFTSIHSKNLKIDDPKEIVFDEFVGQIITIIISALSVVFINQTKFFQDKNIDIINIIFLIVLPFLLFRVVDITKPWPINLIDSKIKGGLGIMLDDIVAAFFAATIQYIITFIIIDFVN